MVVIDQLEALLGGDAAAAAAAAAGSSSYARHLRHCVTSLANDAVDACTYVVVATTRLGPLADEMLTWNGGQKLRRVL